MICVKKITIQKKDKLITMMADAIIFTNKGRRATEGLTCDKKRPHEQNIHCT